MTTSFDISVSLDGFLRAGNPRPDEPLGEHGELLHAWAFGRDPDNRDYLTKAAGNLGAVITGRRKYDDSLPWWGDDGPTGPARLPVFVVTHRHDDPGPGSVYRFVHGITEARDAAAEAAAGRDVTVMGGADVAQQFIRAELVDELSVHLVPVLFGSGTRAFEHLGVTLRRLELIDSLATPLAAHLRYRVVR
jgi:dihydrofolate reductase